MKHAIALAFLVFYLLIFVSCNSTQSSGNVATGVAAGAATGSHSAHQAQQYYGPAN